MANDFQFDDDDFAKDAGASGGGVHDEFDCPNCNANNPVDDTFTHGDEVRCNYCGSEFKVSINQEGKTKFREL
jgi:DNA-directed RNA polymerase subunit RPC12/RpoP